MLWLVRTMLIRICIPKPEKEIEMKKITYGLMFLTALIVLSGCVAGKEPKAGSKVSCPACGYQFEVPAENP